MLLLTILIGALIAYGFEIAMSIGNAKVRYRANGALELYKKIKAKNRDEKETRDYLRKKVDEFVKDEKESSDSGDR